MEDLYLRVQANDHSRYEPVIPVNKTYECGPYSNELEFSVISKALAVWRDSLMRIVTVMAVIKPIQKLVANKPDPDQIADRVLNRA